MQSIKTMFIILTILLITGISSSQTGDEIQKGSVYMNSDNRIPSSLLEELNATDDNGDLDTRMRLNKQVDEILGTAANMQDLNKTSTITANFNNPPFEKDWYTSDVQVYSGSVASAGGFRQLDLKRGEDGWMYLVVNKSGSPGAFSIYMSSNGGATWPGVINYSAGSGYIHNIAMLVESRSNSVLDSTRLLVYFTFGSTINGDNASLYCLNVKRTGIGGVVYSVGSPGGGNKFEYVSACSDGMYYTSATFVHAVVREATNAGVQVGIRHFRSTNFAASHTGVLINTTYNDYYPSCAFSAETGTDSVYIAVERRISATEYELRMIVTSGQPTTNHRIFYITNAVSGIKYEKPAITIVQQSVSIPKKVLVTYTRNRNPRYCYSSDGGGTWSVDNLLAPNSVQIADYTICNSDSLTSGGQYVIAGYVTDDGDSVSVKQGSIPGGLPYVYYKRNSHQASGVVAPVCAIYKNGATKYAAFGYAGFGPTNVYYNAEHMLTAVQPVSNNIPDKFELSQNYPNPFNPATYINFSIPEQGIVKLTIYDLLGREHAVLVNENLVAGTYKVNFDASGLASGVYFYKIQTNGFTDIKKMMLVK